jgi:hypothetical protein
MYNKEIWQRTKQMPNEQQIKEQKWCWFGHTLCKPQSVTETHAMDWNAQGTRKRGSQRKPGKEQNNGNCRIQEKAGQKQKD